MTRDWEHLAGVFWPLLADAAKRRKNLTYGDLAPEIETNVQSVQYSLSHIQQFCLDEKLPPLTALVVNKTTGVPGQGFIGCDVGDLDKVYKEIYAYNWEKETNPFAGFGPKDSIEGFARIIINEPNKACDIYVQVKARGPVQKIFREALLKAYGRKCAMCRFGFEQALEAAHIVPWGECDDSQRLSPTNGILLCANHHKLFDSGRMSVTTDYQICYEDEKLYDYSESDRQATTSLNGKSLRLPENKELAPDPKWLKWRMENR